MLGEDDVLAIALALALAVSAFLILSCFFQQDVTKDAKRSRQALEDGDIPSAKSFAARARDYADLVMNTSIVEAAGIGILSAVVIGMAARMIGRSGRGAPQKEITIASAKVEPIFTKKDREQVIKKFKIDKEVKEPGPLEGDEIVKQAESRIRAARIGKPR
tara:strand:- start:13020 stop:13502 length:483 start_codon:yes stop_codon:yes gene_type:complete